MSDEKHIENEIRALYALLTEANRCACGQHVEFVDLLPGTPLDGVISLTTGALDKYRRIKRHERAVLRRTRPSKDTEQTP
jgi:hypothetical protein